MQEIEELVLPIVKKHLVSFILGLLGVIFLGYGLIHLMPQKSASNDMVFESSAQEASPVKNEISQKPQQQIAVDIEGAILKPGVYNLPSESRVQDLLIAAGGLAPNADRDKIAKGLNLAAKLTDGGKIYIPFQGDTTLGISQDTLGASTSVVNINSATEGELDALPGIGKVTADKIISNRPYQSIEELVQKKVVGAKVFDQIKNKIVTN